MAITQAVFWVVVKELIFKLPYYGYRITERTVVRRSFLYGLVQVIVGLRFPHNSPVKYYE